MKVDLEVVTGRERRRGISRGLVRMKVGGLNWIFGLGSRAGRSGWTAGLDDRVGWLD